MTATTWSVGQVVVWEDDEGTVCIGTVRYAGQNHWQGWIRVDDGHGLVWVKAERLRVAHGEVKP